MKPVRLKPGSTIAIVSPSSGSPSLFPGIYEMGLKNLQDIFGLKVIEYPSARMSIEALYQNPRLRAEDLNHAFLSDEVDGIITSIGGYESVRILKYLDIEGIRTHPKFIMGFSDASTFLSYLNTLGLITFYGPSIMAGFAQLNFLPAQYIQHIKDLLFGTNFPYSYKPYPSWTNGYQDWNNPDTLGQCTTLYENSKWFFSQGSKKVEGHLWGGCIEVLEFMKSTSFWPDASFWEGKILFFETSEDKPLPMQVGYMLRNYGIQGIFEKIKGVVFGRPKDYSIEEKQELNQTVKTIICDEFKASELPIIMDVDIGHTDPKLILPLGGKISLDPENNSIVLLESPYC